ncbi:Sugar (and other) transporter [Nesidiocoris tenuis]|uniref:Sugar (And other) transporter n=1 Tax=Nesidiocoris tenuis TaxID=355587 RepID=A0ABN7B3D1_9HEMI|nr:Sugar (and other) transporter [Nesidiocoris tenuis]
MKHQTCQYCLESTCRLTDVEKRPEIVKEPVRYSIKDVKHPTEQEELQEESKGAELTMEQAIETGKGFAKNKTQQKKLRNFLAQVLASSSKYLMLLDIGMGVSFATIAIPPLQAATTGLKMTEEEASWFASLVFVWQPVGSMTTVAFSKYGRKTAMIFLQLPLLIGWILPYFATSVWQLYIASSIMGLGVGFVQAPIATYIGEVTQPQYRGGLASVAYSMFTLGQVVIFGIDVITGDWRLSAICSSCVPIVTSIVLCLIPESPIWLISKGRYDEAKSALKWLRGWASDEDVEQEYKDLLYHNCRNYAEFCAEEGRNEIKGVCGKFSTEENSKQFASKTSIHPSIAPSESAEMGWARKFFLRPEMYNPMIFILLFMYLSNGSGLGVFRSYLVIILQSFDISMDEGKVTVAVSVVGLLGTVLMVILIPLIGKRKLTFISVILTGLGCLALGLYMMFGRNLNMEWLPLVILVEILFASNLGVSHIPWIIISEIFPLKGRTFGTGLVAGLGNVLQFIGIKLFYTYADLLTIGGVFVMYAITYAVGLVYLYYYQVETEGRPLNEIVEHFRTGRRARR